MTISWSPPISMPIGRRRCGQASSGRTRPSGGAARSLTRRTWVLHRPIGRYGTMRAKSGGRGLPRTESPRRQRFLQGCRRHGLRASRCGNGPWRSPAGPECGSQRCSWTYENSAKGNRANAAAKLNPGVAASVTSPVSSSVSRVPGATNGNSSAVSVHTPSPTGGAPGSIPRDENSRPLTATRPASPRRRAYATTLRARMPVTVTGV